MEDPNKIIVTYRAVKNALSTKESSKVLSSVEEMRVDPVKAAQFMASLPDALDALEECDRRPGVLASPEHPMAAVLQTFLAERAARTGTVVPLPGGATKEAKFDDEDLLGWIGSFFTWWRKISPHHWIHPTQPGVMPAKAKVGILGDWGTGLYGAPVCARSIEDKHKDLFMALHLGDVYYSGTEREIDGRFLGLWPRGGHISRALNSNHEMYTGGYGYFQRTLPKFDQDSSVFAFRNADWLLIGMDTGYDDHDLGPKNDQINYIRNAINSSDGRRVVLFSHHQPYSTFTSQGPKLVEKLGDFLAKKRIFAWYWGHEHRCVVYDKHPAWDLYGRCIGHSGYPYFRDPFDPTARVETNKDGTTWHRVAEHMLVPAGKVLDGPNRYVPDDPAKYGPHGYATLEFDGPTLVERVHNAEGEIIHESKLTP